MFASTALLAADLTVLFCFYSCTIPVCVVLRSRCYRVSDLIGVIRLLKSEQDEDRDGDSDEDYSTPFNSFTLCSALESITVIFIFISNS